MKFKRGQLVVNPNEGYNLYFVMGRLSQNARLTLESLQSDCKGKMIEIQQKDFVKA